MKKQSTLKILKLPDGTLIASGLFKLHDQEGIPLAVSLDECRKHKLKVDWFDFYKDAKTSWAWESTERAVRSALVDSEYPQKFEDTVREIFVSFLPRKKLDTIVTDATVKTGNT